MTNPDTFPEMERLVRFADALAEWCLRNVVDRHGVPIIEHCRAVAAMVHPNLKAAALLHEVIEDGGMCATVLARLGIMEGVVDDVVTMTRLKSETYGQFIARCAKITNGRALKRADLTHNTDPSRGPIPPSLLKRYQKALAVLDKAEEEATR